MIIQSSRINLIKHFLGLFFFTKTGPMGCSRSDALCAKLHKPFFDRFGAVRYGQGATLGRLLIGSRLNKSDGKELL